MKLFNYCFFILLTLCSVAASLEPVLIVLGPPGSGKGTFSQYLKKHYHYNHLSAGDLVRREIDKKSPIGLQIADTVARGEYIDTKVMQALMLQNIEECAQENNPFIIDGFGRTERELDALFQRLTELGLWSKSRLLFFEAEDTLCYERMSHRLLCSHCEKIYNTISCKPKIEGVCDDCLHPLKKRFNDTPAVIEKKIREYREMVETNYRRALDLFPYQFINANRGLEECLHYYTSLVEENYEF